MRLVIAWLAVLVQLNLLFHLELDHRVVGPRVLRDATTVSTAWTRPEPSQAPQPFCPLCQILRQGAVQPGVENLGLSPLQAIARAVPASRSPIPAIFLLYSSGRSPPRG